MWLNDDTDQPHTVTSGGSPDEAGAGAVFDFTAQKRSLLIIEPISVEVQEDEPVTYQLTILKDSQEAFSEEFRTLGGKLYVELVSTDGPTQVTCPDISDAVIGAYHTQGSLLAQG